MTVDVLFGYVRALLEAMDVWSVLSSAFTAMVVLSLAGFVIKLLRG